MYGIKEGATYKPPLSKKFHILHRRPCCPLRSPAEETPFPLQVFRHLQGCSAVCAMASFHEKLRVEDFMDDGKGPCAL